MISLPCNLKVIEIIAAASKRSEKHDEQKLSNRHIANVVAKQVAASRSENLEVVTNR